MRHYVVNPDNPIVSLNKVHSNRLNRDRVWKPLGLLVVAGLTPLADAAVRQEQTKAEDILGGAGGESELPIQPVS
jgi:hypothetical protein